MRFFERIISDARATAVLGGMNATVVAEDDELEVQPTAEPATPEPQTALPRTDMALRVEQARPTEPADTGRRLPIVEALMPVTPPIDPITRTDLRPDSSESRPQQSVLAEVVLSPPFAVADDAESDATDEPIEPRDSRIETAEHEYVPGADLAVVSWEPVGADDDRRADARIPGPSGSTTLIVPPVSATKAPDDSEQARGRLHPENGTPPFNEPTLTSPMAVDVASIETTEAQPPLEPQSTKIAFSPEDSTQSEVDRATVERVEVELASLRRDLSFVTLQLKRLVDSRREPPTGRPSAVIEPTGQVLAEPTVHIEQIDVIVEAQAEPRSVSPASDVGIASRSYLRRL